MSSQNVHHVLVSVLAFGKSNGVQCPNQIGRSKSAQFFGFCWAHDLDALAQLAPAPLRHRVAAPVVDKNGGGRHNLRSLPYFGSAVCADQLGPDSVPVLGTQVPTADGPGGFALNGDALLNRNVPISRKPRRYVAPISVAKSFRHSCLPAEHVGSPLERSLMWEVQSVHARKSKQV